MNKLTLRINVRTSIHKCSRNWDETVIQSIMWIRIMSLFGSKSRATTPLLRQRRSCGEEIWRLSLSRKFNLHVLWLLQLCHKPNNIFGFRGQQQLWRGVLWCISKHAYVLIRWLKPKGWSMYLSHTCTALSLLAWPTRIPLSAPLSLKKEPGQTPRVIGP